MTTVRHLSVIRHLTCWLIAAEPACRGLTSLKRHSATQKAFSATQKAFFEQGPNAFVREAGGRRAATPEPTRQCLSPSRSGAESADFVRKRTLSAAGCKVAADQLEIQSWAL